MNTFKTNTIYVLLFLLPFTFACKKKTPIVKQTNTVGSDFFVEGKGFRKVWGMESQTSGLGGFNLSMLTYSPQGFIHTIFTYGLSGVNGSPAYYTAYRKKINITTGDTVATSGIPASIPREWLGGLQTGCLEYNLVPYTDVLAYLKGGNVVGNPNWMSLPFASGFEKIYDTKQIMCFGSYSYIVNPQLGLQYYSGGNNYAYKVKPLPLQALCASVELTKDGDPLSFTATKLDSLQVYDFNTNKLLASIYLPLFQQYLPSNATFNFKPDATITTKRSEDGSKIIGHISHIGNYLPGGRRILTTFIYDIASKKLTLKVQNAQFNAGSYISNTQDVDDDGNFYYGIIEFNVTIRKISPLGGNEVFKTGFIQGTGSLINLKCVMNKVIIACASVGNNMFGIVRKGALVIAVAE